MQKPDQLEVYSVIFLVCKDQFLLLQRSLSKAFAPGRWTGLGGHVEIGEFSQLTSAALREVQEESGISASEIEAFTLRRSILVPRPGLPLRLVLYYTGWLAATILPESTEGRLQWVHPAEFRDLDIIETTRAVLDRLVEDVALDPQGAKPADAGLAVFTAEDKFQHIVWVDRETRD